MSRQRQPGLPDGVTVTVEGEEVDPLLKVSFFQRIALALLMLYGLALILLIGLTAANVYMLWEIRSEWTAQRTAPVVFTPAPETSQPIAPVPASALDLCRATVSSGAARLYSSASSVARTHDVLPSGTAVYVLARANNDSISWYRIGAVEGSVRGYVYQTALNPLNGACQVPDEVRP